MNKNSLTPSMLIIFLEQKEEWKATRYIILKTFSTYFCKKNERASCVYGVEREKLMMMMMMRVKDRSCDLLLHAMRLNIRR